MARTNEARLEAEQPGSGHRFLGDVGIRRVAPACSLATWQNVVVSVWRGQPLPADVYAVGDVVTEIFQGTKEPVSTLTILEDGMAIANAESRRAGASLLASSKRIAGPSVVVLLGTGFWASALRGLLMSLGFVSGSKTLIASSTQEATAHLARHLKKGVQWQQDLGRAAELVRSER